MYISYNYFYTNNMAKDIVANTHRWEYLANSHS